MKRQIFFFVAALTATMSFAQFKVNQYGIISAGSPTTTPAKFNIRSSTQGIYSNITPEGNATMSGYTTSAIVGQTSHEGSENSIGVKGIVTGDGLQGAAFGLYGEAITNLSGRNYGVFGHIVSTVNGAAIYGSTHTSCLGETLTGNYAGYFEGNVLTSGNLGVTGGINGLVLGHQGDVSDPGGYYVNGDERSEMSQRLRKLGLSTFFINRDKNQAGTSEEVSELKEDGKRMTLTEKQILSKQHYGLSATQLEEIFPDLVYENEDGSKSISYMELVPILVQVINEMGAKIEALENGSQKHLMPSATGVSTSDDNIIMLNLGQNKPNPFGETTSIPVSVPEDVQSAFLYVYNLNGNKVAQVDIPARGTTSVTLSAATLSEGMYLYSLVADGKIVQTRRMIVEK